MSAADDPRTRAPVEVSIVIPCLNEAKTVGVCVKKALSTLERLGVPGEVVVADNGSTDGSVEIAGTNGARVVSVQEQGYGSALFGGIEAARGTYIIMGDADDSYDFTGIEPFIAKLREGYDLVMGNRFTGGIKPGAMPKLHQYFGNPVLSLIGRLFFGVPVGDFFCGLRGFTKQAAERMALCTTGMEFAHEIVVKAALHKMHICEVPTTLSPDGRDRAPHLRSWRDGWRALRFLLIFSPRWLFFYPGLALIALGLMFGGNLLTTYRTNSLLLSYALVLIGLQAISFTVIVHAFASHIGMMPPSPRLEKFNALFSLELGLLVAAVLVALGLVGYGYGTFVWARRDFTSFPAGLTRLVIIPCTFSLVCGVQIALNSFVLSIFSLEHIRPRTMGSPTSAENKANRAEEALCASYRGPREQ